jgi:hypothetical protein
MKIKSNIKAGNSPLAVNNPAFKESGLAGAMPAM